VSFKNVVENRPLAKNKNLLISYFGYRRVKTHDGKTKTDKQQKIRVVFLSRFLDKNIYLRWRYIYFGQNRRHRSLQKQGEHFLC